jgi:class 3 adenylate cyclase/tetratricopeptide (TPR) repeat protein
MTDAPEPSAVERRIVSVLFADLVGFTPLSERLDAEDVATIQDAYFDATRETIQRYGGVVEKFIGDAAMAVFGAPRSRDDDAERSVRAGLALIGAVEQLNARLGLEPDALQLRVGVNTGEVVHATAGTDAGRVTGDTVNTAARFQAAARPGSVLIGELTALTVADAIETAAVGQVELKGKAEPVRAWEAVGTRSHPSREEALGTLRAPTLGREAELERLRAAIATVGDERRAERLLIVAPPGVGKSRLLAELAATTDATVLRARVRPQGTAPFETVAQLFEGLELDALEAALASAGTPAARGKVIAAEVRRLHEPGEAPHPASGDLAAERDARFEAWTAALDALTDRPSAWLVEDVHWAGPDLLAFLDHAGRAPSRHGRLLVTTARPSLLESAREWCETQRIDLAPLPPTDAANLVHALVGDALPAELVDAVVERSDGTPLFIEELIRTWASVATLVAGDDGRWSLAVQPDAVLLPQTVQAIYAAQLDDLPPDARLVARRGSVAGRRVPMAALHPLELEDRRDGVEILLRRDFLAGPLSDEVTGEAYAYRHALLRDAGYASLARVERARLHVAMAAWLEQVAADRADVIAEAIAEHHALALDSLPALASGDLPDRAALARSAAAWYERAAAAALGLSAHEAARRLLERSIDLTDAEDAPLDLARRRLRLGEILSESADLDAGIGHLEAAVAIFADWLPDTAAGYAEAVYALGRSYMQQIRFPEAGTITSSALAALDAAGADEPAGRSRLMALHAWSVSALDLTDGVLDEARAAEELAATVGDPTLELDVLEHVTSARGEVGTMDPDAWSEIARRALALGRWQQAAIATRIRAFERVDHDPAAALPGIDAAAELAQAHGMTEQSGWCELARCETLFVIGRWDEALDSGLRAIELGERYAYIRLAFRTWVVLLPMLAARRDSSLLERHARWWRQAKQHFPTNPSPYGSFLTAAVGAWRAAAAGETPPVPDASLTAFDLGFSNPHFLAAVETVTDAWLAHDRLDLARAIAAKPVDDEATPLMRSSSDLVRARVAAAEGASQDPHAHARDSAAHARGIGASWWLARALRLLGDPEADALEAALGIAGRVPPPVALGAPNGE